MPARMQVTIDDADVRQAFARIIAAGGDLTPMLDEMGSYLVLSIDRRFETETGPGGNPWPKSIRALVQGGQTLTDSGRLRGSITHNVLGGNAVEVGTNVAYAGIHQMGGTITAKNAPYLTFRIGGQWVRKKSVTIPARPFLGIDDADETELLAIAEDYVRDAAGPEAIQ